jgi:hypothetical protein
VLYSADLPHATHPTVLFSAQALSLATRVRRPGTTSPRDARIWFFVELRLEPTSRDVNRHQAELFSGIITKQSLRLFVAHLGIDKTTILGRICWRYDAWFNILRFGLHCDGSSHYQHTRERQRQRGVLD